MRKIGLLGGTFDPIHYGHLLAAQSALEAAGLDEVRFVPTFVPPHKPQPGASAAARRRMAEAAIAGNAAFRIEDIELARAGTSYTIDTVLALRQRERDAVFYWIIGSDMVNTLPSWRRIEELAEMVAFIAFEREEDPADESLLPAFIRARLLHAAMPPVGFSSSDIRRRCKEGRSIRYMVPDPVAELIRKEGLYGG